MGEEWGLWSGSSCQLSWRQSSSTLWGPFNRPGSCFGFLPSCHGTDGPALPGRCWLLLVMLQPTGPAFQGATHLPRACSMSPHTSPSWAHKRNPFLSSSPQVNLLLMQRSIHVFLAQIPAPKSSTALLVHLRQAQPNAAETAIPCAWLEGNCSTLRSRSAQVPLGPAPCHLLCLDRKVVGVKGHSPPSDTSCLALCSTASVLPLGPVG